MIVHLFNSSSISGPEKLVLPALAASGGRFAAVNLREERIGKPGDPDPMEDYCRAVGLPYEAISVAGRWDRNAVARLANLLKRTAPALVHAHDVKASLYLLRAAEKEPGARPLVSTHHGVRGRPDLKSRAYEWAYRRLFLRKFDRALCVSSADHEILSASGVPAERLRLHLNGVDGRYVDPRDRPAKSLRLRRVLLPTRWESRPPFLFGVVGRLSAEKDHARILMTLAALERTSPARDWKCLIFGDGPLKKSLQRRAVRLGISGKTLWMGYRPAAADEIAALDLVLSFSKAEGLPINLIEAGWAGTPVMATQVGGVNDLIPTDGFGNVVPVEEPPRATARRINGLMSEEGAQRLRAQGARFQKRVVESFSRAKWLKRLRELYREVDVAIEPREADPAPEALHAVAR
jgi:glycosyltransferase involved in cell wall biosynthesis